MFDAGGDDVLPSRRMAANSPKNREVVGLRPAAQEDDFLGIAVQQGRGLAPGLFQMLLGQLAVQMDTGRVSIHFK